MELKLFMVLIGCRPKGRNSEQHDIYFGIGTKLKDLIPQFEKFWPEAKGNMHVDAWREVTHLNGYQISVSPKAESLVTPQTQKLFFINLGGYKPAEFDEFHYKFLTVSDQKAEAIKMAKQTAFFKHTGFAEAPSHIDDRFGIDVDEVHEIDEILLTDIKNQYSIKIIPTNETQEDLIHLGYFRLDKL